MNPEIKVNMTGKEYMEYKQKSKIKFKPNQIQAFVIFGFCFVGILFISILLNSIIHVPSTSPNLLVSWIKFSTIMSQTSWENIAKMVGLLFAPVIAIAWLIHGVGFFIVKG